LGKRKKKEGLNWKKEGKGGRVDEKRGGMGWE